jgi:hypothetical protein
VHHISPVFGEMWENVDVALQRSDREQDFELWGVEISHICDGAGDKQEEQVAIGN